MCRSPRDKNVVIVCIMFIVGDCLQPSVGNIVVGQVRKVMSHECLLVSFGAGLLGRVDITDASDDYTDDPFSKSTPYSIVKCVYNTQ